MCSCSRAHSYNTVKKGIGWKNSVIALHFGYNEWDNSRRIKTKQKWWITEKAQTRTLISKLLWYSVTHTCWKINQNTFACTYCISVNYSLFVLLIYFYLISLSLYISLFSLFCSLRLHPFFHLAHESYILQNPSLHLHKIHLTQFSWIK